MSGQHRNRPPRFWNLPSLNRTLRAENTELRRELRRLEVDYARLTREHGENFQELMSVREQLEEPPVEQVSEAPGADVTQELPRFVRRTSADRPTSAMATSPPTPVNLNRNSE